MPAAAPARPLCVGAANALPKADWKFVCMGCCWFLRMDDEGPAMTGDDRICWVLEKRAKSAAQLVTLGTGEALACCDGSGR